MPGPIVTQGSLVQCAHAGPARPAGLAVRVTADGQPLALATSVFTVSGCALTGGPTPPCTTLQWLAPATRVTAGGAPVLLRTSAPLSPSNGFAALVVTTQTRVVAT